MSNDKEAKDFKLDELEKPLTEQEMKETTGGAATGLVPEPYVQVIDGQIKINNPGGSNNFSAGQFGYTPNIKQPPVIIPNNPGLQFTPPPKLVPSATPSSTPSQGSDPGSS
ncbi:hypothetical protein DFP93_10162 [Aneurinibacillus soli]|uniref:Uncharacterized protein n=1 Tax=Aneurinibacillus soli TaxID=1500254 RepID=A0A0U5C743_9BACL|nr:hypothetical protein [Aneurinibacillus soli]PYE64038.1 hypothetical protein DFP93_10162 [Aneurinibacillus soli]BAU27987.1 hypothetical protein CB4_02161 [Aneurinibacillus soli]